MKQVENVAEELVAACREFRQRVTFIEQMLKQVQVSTAGYQADFPDNVHELRVFDGTSGYSIVRGKKGDPVCLSLNDLDNDDLIAAAPVFVQLATQILNDIHEKTKKTRDILTELGATPVATHDG